MRTTTFSLISAMNSTEAATINTDLDAQSGWVKCVNKRPMKKRMAPSASPSEEFPTLGSGAVKKGPTKKVWVVRDTKQKEPINHSTTPPLPVKDDFPALGSGVVQNGTAKKIWVTPKKQQPVEKVPDAPKKPMKKMKMKSSSWADDSDNDDL